LRYEIKPDPKTADVSRACFLSHDPNIYINENAVPIQIEEALKVYKKLEPPIVPQLSICRSINNSVLTEAVNHIIENNNTGTPIYNL
jgi:hypothetical protein